MAVRSTGFVQTILGPSAGSIVESAASTIGHITLDVKQTGEPGAGKPPARFDVAGAGEWHTAGLLRHSQRKRGATDRLDLRCTAPALDPTGRGETEKDQETLLAPRRLPTLHHGRAVL